MQAKPEDLVIGIAYCRIGVKHGFRLIELDRPKSCIGKIHLHIGHGIGLIGGIREQGNPKSERIARVFDSSAPLVRLPAKSL